jgi:hypothetical protein
MTAIPSISFRRSATSTSDGLITAVVCLALAAVVAAMASLLLPGGAIGDRYGRRVALITLPESRRARAVSIWAAVAGGAAVLGLLAGARC